MTLETWSRWREPTEREGIRFAAAPEYQVFPTRERPLKPYAAAVKAAATTRRLIRDLDPEVVVADILTVAGALAAELEGRPWATLVPPELPMPFTSVSPLTAADSSCSSTTPQVSV